MFLLRLRKPVLSKRQKKAQRGFNLHWSAYFILALVVIPVLVTILIPFYPRNPAKNSTQTSTDVLFVKGYTGKKDMTGTAFIAHVPGKGAQKYLCTIAHIANLHNLTGAKLTGSFEIVGLAPVNESVKCAPLESTLEAFELSYEAIPVDSRIPTGSLVAHTLSGNYEMSSASYRTGAFISLNPEGNERMVEDVVLSTSGRYLLPGDSGAPLTLNGKVVGVHVGGNQALQENSFIMFNYPANLGK